MTRGDLLRLEPEAPLGRFRFRDLRWALRLSNAALSRFGPPPLRPPLTPPTAAEGLALLHRAETALQQKAPTPVAASGPRRRRAAPVAAEDDEDAFAELAPFLPPHLATPAAASAPPRLPSQWPVRHDSHAEPRIR